MRRFSEKRPRLVEILSRSERIIYYGAAFALILTVGMIFVSAAISVVRAFGAESLEASFIDTVLTGLVIALSGALYFTRRAERHNTEEQGVHTPRSV